MNATAMTWWQVAAAVPLVGVAVAAAGYQRLGLTRDLVTAAVRAAAQLAAVGAVLLLLFAHAATAGILGWIAVMLLIAGQVAGRRGRVVPRARVLATIAIATGSLPVLVALTVFGVLAVRAEVMIPISGMVIATAMQAGGVTLLRVAEDVGHHRPAIETRLALGMPATAAFAPHRRSAVRTALLPAIDSTKVVGLVSLPGAMTGLIIAGVDPLTAIRYQVVVMYMLLAAATSAATTSAYLAHHALFDTTAHRLRTPETAGGPGRWTIRGVVRR
ncbi:ABC transporter permease [Nocardia fusca]|uniref:ABC transporter permease n=1 Tax=Nocardia fusca TaxID=941183 RepID=UPI001E622CE0|nr:iron export ABC transporter permease subunit FetB [Nocardia fusca]